MTTNLHTVLGPKLVPYKNYAKIDDEFYYAQWRAVVQYDENYVTNGKEKNRVMTNYAKRCKPTSKFVS